MEVFRHGVIRGHWGANHAPHHRLGGRHPVECVDTGLVGRFFPIPSHATFTFQFRAESFNLFNHPQWPYPNVTFANGAFGSQRSHRDRQRGHNRELPYRPAGAEDELLTLLPHAGRHGKAPPSYLCWLQGSWFR